VHKPEFELEPARSNSVRITRVTALATHTPTTDRLQVRPLVRTCNVHARALANSEVYLYQRRYVFNGITKLKLSPRRYVYRRTFSPDYSTMRMIQCHDMMTFSRIATQV